MTQILKPEAPQNASVGGGLTAVPDAAAWELYANQWERHLKARNIAPSTIRTYLRSYATLSAWGLGQGIESPEDCESGDLEEFFAWIPTRPGRANGTKAAPAYAAKLFRELRVFYRWLSDQEAIPSPMAKLKAPLVPEKPVSILTDSELSALVEACKGRGFTERRDMAIVRILLDTGIRLEEVATLTLESPNLAEQVLTVMGKGRRERRVAYGAKTAEALDSYLRARAKHRDRKLPSLWLASSPHRGALGYDGVRQLLLRRAELAGVENVHPHRFRHTAAHAWFDAGGQEGDAMRQFGWRTRSMVDRYGAAAAEERSIRSARKLSTGDRI